MSEETTRRIIEVEVDQTKAISSLVEYQNKIKEITAEENKWKEQLKAGEITQAEYDKKLAASTEVKKEYKRIINETSREIQNSLKRDKEKADSMKSLRAELGNATKQYDEMSKAERESAKGQDLLKHINEITDEIKDVEESTQRYQRNVGNYKSALQDFSFSLGTMSDALGQAGVATGGLDKAMKVLKANPIILFITAIVAVIKAVVDAFKRNEEATMGLKQAFSAFNPIIDAVKRIFESFASVIVTVVSSAVKGLTSAIGWLLDKVQDLGNFFGADWHMGDNFKNGTKAAVELQAAENAYILNKRNWVREEAKLDNEIEVLREKATDKLKYSNKERLAFLDEVIQKETQKAEKEKALAEENLRIIKAEAERSANDAEMNDKLAQAEAEVYRVETELLSKKKELNAQREEAVNAMNAESKSIKDNTQATADNTAEIEKQRQVKEQQAIEYAEKTLSEMQKAEDALNALIKDEYEKRRAIENTSYERSSEDLQSKMDAEAAAHGENTALWIAYYQQLESLAKQHANIINDINAEQLANEKSINDKKKADAEATLNSLKAIEKSRLEYSTQIVNSLSTLMDTMAGDNKQMVKASKIVALAEVAIKQGVAIAEAVASSAKGDPYTYAFRVAAAIASTVAAMAKAISSINSAKFAKGGKIKGAGTTTSDDIPILVSDQEAVINAKSVKKYPSLLNAINSAEGGTGIEHPAALTSEEIGMLGMYSPTLSMLSSGAPAQVEQMQQQLNAIDMANAMKEAVRDLNISVSVDEINTKQSRLKVMDSLSKM